MSATLPLNSMPSQMPAAKPARAPATGGLPARTESKHAPYDAGPWYAGRVAWQRALESDKKR